MKKLIICKKSLFLQTELAKDKSLKSKDSRAVMKSGGSIFIVFYFLLSIICNVSFNVLT